MNETSTAAAVNRFRRAALVSIITLLALLLAGTESVAGMFGDGAAAIVRGLRSGQLSRRDQDQLTRGYYENLTGVNRFNSRLWEVYAGTESPEDRRPLRDTDLVTHTGDFQFMVLKPSLRSSYRGQPFHTNGWGMRDREYTRTPAPGVRRIALLGQSYVMGGGVANEETFEARMETELNTGRDGGRVEILNFASGNYMPARQLVQLERTVLSFEPHVVISVGHQSDLRRIPSNFADALFANADIPLPFVKTLIDSLGIRTSTPHEEIMRLLTPYRERIFREIQREFVEATVAAGALPVWVLIPTPDHGPRDEEVEFMIEASREAGFHTFDLFDVYGNDPASYWVASWDSHPDVAGHNRIATRLLSALREDARILNPQD